MFAVDFLIQLKRVLVRGVFVQEKRECRPTGNKTEQIPIRLLIISLDAKSVTTDLIAYTPRTFRTISN